MAMPDPGRPSLRDTSGPDSPADPLAAILAEMHERGQWRSSADEIAAPGATAIGSAADVPRLLAAVEAVLALHHEAAGKCASCLGSWPCGEYLSLSRALLGDTP